MSSPALLLYDRGMMIMRFLVVLFFALPAAGAANAAQLVMVEQAGCEWCEAWDREIAPSYHRTAEGRIAPLRRVDINDPLPRDLAFIRRLVYTPTFVLVHNGREVGRILGYPGEDFFWGLLEELIAKLPVNTKRDIRARLLPVKQGRDKNPQTPRG